MQIRKKLAILVGVTAYQNENEPLPFCKQDVEAMQDILSKKGFSCTVLVDGDIRDILNHLVTASKDARSSTDTIVFYFSGHGAEVIGEQVLLGQKGSLSSLGKALHQGDLILLSDVLDKLSYSPALKLVIIDACRTSLNVSETDLINFAQSLRDRKRTAFQNISNCVVAYASADGQKSRGSNDIGSVFTLELVEQLKNYNCDFIYAVQNSVAKMRTANVTQIPWLYASTYSSKVPDRVRVEEHALFSRGWSRFNPKESLGCSGGETYGVRGYNLLIFIKGKWTYHSGIQEYGDLRKITFARDRLAIAAIRGKSAYFAVPSITAPLSKNSTTPQDIVFKKLGSSMLTEAYGISVAPDGGRVCMFGFSGESVHSIACWSIDPNGKKRQHELVGIPQSQCNAVLWISPNSFFATFSREDSEKSRLFNFEMNTDGILVGSFVEYIVGRVTALEAESSDVLWLGDSTGAISKKIFSLNSLTRIERQHNFDPAARIINEKNWKGIGDGITDRSPAVFCMSYLSEKNVLAVSYFDTTIAFYDTTLETLICDYPPKELTRYQLVSKSASGSFLVLRGLESSQFKVEEG